MLLRRARWALLALALVGTLVAGAAAGIIADQAYPDQVPLLASHRATKGLDEATTERALRVLQNNYYDTRFDYSKLSHGTVRGLILGLDDRFSYYLDPAEYQRQLNTYSGQYVGIGIEVGFAGDYPVVNTVFNDSPAQKGGLKPRDVLVSADGRDLHGLTSDQASNLIRGRAGTTVVLGVERAGERLSLPIRREAITIPSVRSAKLENGILYLRIYTFGESTADDFDRQLKAGLPGARGIVLDLRNDGGGFIDAAQHVIGQFVSKGEAFELRDRGGHVERKQVAGNPLAGSIPVAVLVNGDTASASEMVSGSLQVHRRGRLIGSLTFGKGSVQQDFPLPDGSDLHITIRRWFLPDGVTVEKKGLTPDVEVRLAKPEDMFDVARPELGHLSDSQLNRALELLSAPPA